MGESAATTEYAETEVVVMEADTSGDNDPTPPGDEGSSSGNEDGGDEEQIKFPG
jgi:hypothetical protein